MHTPLISVIVPVYNVEKYIEKCLDSLINQTLKEIEIICVDDCGTDNSVTIVKKYMQQDKRIKLIQHKKNSGSSAARNTGIKNTSTPYIMFCDSDDFYKPDMCEKMYHAINSSKADIACCGCQIIYQAKHELKASDDEYYRIKFKGIADIDGKIIKNTDVSAWNKIYRRDLIEKYRIEYPEGLWYEDADFFFKYMSVAKKVFFVPEALYCYMRRENSIMDKTFQHSIKALDHLKIMNDVRQFLIKNNLFEKWKKIFYSIYIDSFCFAHNWLPNDKKNLAYQKALPFMQSVPKEDIVLLSENEQNTWYDIIYQRYIQAQKKKIKLGPLTLCKIKQNSKKYQIFVLGIKVFERKIKKGKIKYNFLYMPVYQKKFAF